jgi:hypothetical protein
MRLSNSSAVSLLRHFFSGFRRKIPLPKRLVLAPYMIDMTCFIGFAQYDLRLGIAVLREFSLRAGKLSDVQGG